MPVKVVSASGPSSAPPTLVEGSIFLTWPGNPPNYWQTTAVPCSRLWHTAGLICHIHTNKITRSDVFYFDKTDRAMVIVKELMAPTKPARGPGRQRAAEQTRSPPTTHGEWSPSPPCPHLRFVAVCEHRPWCRMPWSNPPRDLTRPHGVGVPRGLGSGLPGTQAAPWTAAATKQREKLVSLTPPPTYADTVDHSAACRQRRLKAGVLICNGGIKPPPLGCL